MLRRLCLLPFGVGLLLPVAGCLSRDPLGADRKAEDLQTVSAGAPLKWTAAAKVTPASATGWIKAFDARSALLAVQALHLALGGAF